MKKLYNPLDKALTVMYKGHEETIEAKATKDVSDELAAWWKGKIHTFLVESETAPVKEFVAPSTEEAKEEVVEAPAMPKLEAKIAEEAEKKKKGKK